MADAYLLPCGCGKKTPVGKAQAGQVVACECGKTLGVPTLRGLRDLELAPASKESTPIARPTWGPLRGASFSGGLAVAAVALFLSGLNLSYYSGAKFYSDDPSEQIIGAATNQLDGLAAVELLDEWNNAVKDGLGSMPTPFWIAAQESAKIYRWRSIAFACLSLVGLATAIGAAFFGRR